MPWFSTSLNDRKPGSTPSSSPSGPSGVTGPLPFPERPTFGSGLLLTTVLTVSRPFDDEMATSMLVLFMLLLPRVTLSAPVLIVGVMVAVLTVVAVVGVVTVRLGALKMT